MTEQHLITPPPELVQQWVGEANEYIEQEEYAFAARAAQWGADQELEACCSEASFKWSTRSAQELRAARRPKPPSLKQQSIALLDLIQGNEKSWQLEDLDVVRRALEALPDD
jgi:hypothetical protein